jgi:excisionase family DNA binding protein
MSQIFTIPEAAVKLKMHKGHVYKLAERGLIPAVKIGGSWRISEENLERLLNGEVVVRGTEEPKQAA